MLLWSDSFDRYGATADVNTLYSSGNMTFQSALGLNGGGCVRMTGSGGSSITRTFSTAGTITAGNGVHVSMWIKLTTQNDTNNGSLLSIGTNLQGVSGSGGGARLIVSNSTIVAQRHGDGATVGTSAVGTFALGTYYHLEYAAKFNTAANGGYIKVWINGNLVIDFAGDTNSGTVPSTFTAVRIGTSFGSGIVDLDDLICWDENGTDFVHTQLSTDYLPIIEVIDVDGNDSVQFTPSAGSNFQNLDETGWHNSDTDYNFSSTVGHVDLFTLEAIAASPGAIFGLAIKTVAKIDIAGTINLRVRLDSNGTVVDSSDILLGTGYVQYYHPFGKNPDGAVDWTESAVNALKTGYVYQS